MKKCHVYHRLCETAEGPASSGGLCSGGLGSGGLGSGGLGWSYAMKQIDSNGKCESIRFLTC